ncbi:hypothetical protein BDN71DRAFT_1451579, partial [Pleurotus eryngii]
MHAHFIARRYWHQRRLQSRKQMVYAAVTTTYCYFRYVAEVKMSHNHSRATAMSSLNGTLQLILRM